MAVVLNTDKVLATRDIYLWFKEYHSTNRPPATTVAWGADWGTPAGQTGAYTFGGYTQGGLGFSEEISRTDIRMDQSMDPVLRPATGRTVNLTANLGEFDLDSLSVATGQGTVDTYTPATPDPGYDRWQMGLTVADNFYTVAFDINHPGDDLPVRVFAWYAQPVGAQSWNFSPEAAALTPFNVTAFPDPSNGNRVCTIYDLFANV